MFHDIDPRIVTTMTRLEDLDRRDRTDGTARLARLRQIPADTGRFLALLAASAPRGRWIEVGTSAGYSTMWLALAAREVGAEITTFEILSEKVALAERTFAEAGLGDVVHLIHGDFLEHAENLNDVALCFLDAEKEVYAACYDLVVPQLVPGGVLIADNAINHAATLQPLIDDALVDVRVDALVVPIGKGELVCRRRSH